MPEMLDARHSGGPVEVLGKLVLTVGVGVLVIEGTWAHLGQG